MLSHSHLFDPARLRSLLEEFRRSMRRLLDDLCDELDGPYRRESIALRVPVGYVRWVGASLAREDFSHWRVVGWIEALNDLVYLLDVRRQLERDPDERGFAESFLAACEQQFYEHGYLDELFPRGTPDAAGLARRLNALCRTLARQATQESLFLVPGAACRWLWKTGRPDWSVRLDLSGDVERVEPPGCLAFGLDGAFLQPPAPVRRRLKASPRGILQVSRTGMSLLAGGVVADVWGNRSGGKERPLWRVRGPVHVISAVNNPPAFETGHPDVSHVTLGPTLVYGADRTPRTIVPTQLSLRPKFDRAFQVLRNAWPEGAGNVACLTTRIIPLKARGVVSFSYRHRPGLSFLNCFDRDDLDLVDDLVHENSHHHLNLLLRKAALIKGQHNEERFYSPWRRSLRPLRGILHATFTFTMGAILFERLAASDTLRSRDRMRSRFRCLEEVDSVRYSLHDLDDADMNLGWLTKPGAALIESLRQEIHVVKKRIAPCEPGVLASRHGPALRRHRQELQAARQTYGGGSVRK
jgi:HEXXH motif-containing protein